MKSDPELSASGNPVYRHESPKSSGDLASGDSENIERITQHIETHLGPVTTVFHELVSPVVHIDIHLVNPTEDRPFYTLVTSGMSDRPMTVPEGSESLRYAELAICLPPDWLMDPEDWRDPNHYWPIEALKFLARFPHEYQTWICLDHTIPHGNPPSVYAPNCPYSCALIGPVSTAPLEFGTLEVSPEKTIHFFGVQFIYLEEMEFKMEAGAEPLFEAFDAMGYCEVVDLQRESVVE